MAKPGELVKRVLALAAAAVALLLCVGGALALWGLRGFRGEVCLHLSDVPAIVERTGRLTRCDQRSADAQGASEFDLEGPQGAGRAYVTSETDRHGNVLVRAVRFVTDGGSIVIE